MSAGRLTMFTVFACLLGTQAALAQSPPHQTKINLIVIGKGVGAGVRSKVECSICTHPPPPGDIPTSVSGTLTLIIIGCDPVNDPVNVTVRPDSLQYAGKQESIVCKDNPHYVVWLDRLRQSIR